MRKYWGRLIIFSFIIALIVTSFTLQEYDGNNKRDDWNIIVSQFHDYLKDSERSFEDLDQSLITSESDAQRYVQNTVKRISELDFLLQLHNVTNVFELTLYCKQISDLKYSFDQRTALLHKFQRNIKENIERFDILFVSLQSMNRQYLTSAQVGNLDNTLMQCSLFKQNSKIRLQKLDNMLKTVDEIAPLLNTLYEKSEEKRKFVIENIFFAQVSDFGELYPLSQLVMKSWFNNIQQWIQIQIPSDKVFWFNFLILAGLFFIPIFYIGKFIYNKYLSNMAFFPDKYLKTKAFVIAWLLGSITLASFFSQYLLLASEITFFSMMIQSCISISLLIFALALRLERSEMRKSMLLYFPQILQHFTAVIMAILLIPYGPLILLLPIINFIFAVAVSLLLFFKKFNTLDTVLGVLSVIVSIFGGAMAFYGFPYVGFTITLLYFVLIAEFQLVVALTELIFRYVKGHGKNLIVNNLLTKLLIPLLWFSLLRDMSSKMANTYHLENEMNRWMMENISVFTGTAGAQQKIISFCMTDIITIIIVLFVIIFVISTAKKILLAIYGDDATFGLVPSFITLGTYLIWGLFFIFILVTMEVQYSSILVILGGVSMGLGFALKDVAENFISGIILLVGQQIRPGDMIEFNSIHGKVLKVSFRATVVETYDGAIITFPNAQVITKEFKNWTCNHLIMRRDIIIGVSYNSDMELVRKVIMNAVSSISMIRTQPSPELFCVDFGSSSVNFKLQIWVSISQHIIACSLVREKIFEAFKANGIEIPFDQLDLHVINDTSNVLSEAAASGVMEVQNETK